MLVGYFDESGNDERSKAFCVGGYIADSRTWFDLGRHWKRTLDEFDVSCFHATDCLAGRKAFQGWDETRKTALMTELISVINSFDVAGVAAGILKHDHEASVQRKEHEVLGLPARQWKNPYFLCFETCITDVALEFRDWERGTVIPFVFDRQKDFSSTASRIYQSLKASTFSARGCLGDLEFKGKDGCPPLQAADLLVCELRRDLERRSYDSGRPMRRSLTRLLKRKAVLYRYYDAAGIEILLESKRQVRADIAAASTGT